MDWPQERVVFDYKASIVGGAEFESSAALGRPSSDRTNASNPLLKCNVLVQEKCPTNLVDHIGLASNGVVYSGIRQALEHKPVALDCSAL